VFHNGGMEVDYLLMRSAISATPAVMVMMIMGNRSAVVAIRTSAMVGVVFIPRLYRVSYSCSLHQHHAWMHPIPAPNPTMHTITHVIMQHPGSVACKSPTQHAIMEIILGRVGALIPIGVLGIGWWT
jgi:hypothetical protein